jgi:hypothetical protein
LYPAFSRSFAVLTGSGLVSAPTPLDSSKGHGGLFPSERLTCLAKSSKEQGPGGNSATQFVAITFVVPSPEARSSSWYAYQ